MYVKVCVPRPATVALNKLPFNALGGVLDPGPTLQVPLISELKLTKSLSKKENKSTAVSSSQALAPPSILSSPGYPPKNTVTVAFSPQLSLVYINLCSPKRLILQRFSVPVFSFKANLFTGFSLAHFPPVLGDPFN